MAAQETAKSDPTVMKTGLKIQLWYNTKYVVGSDEVNWVVEHSCGMSEKQLFNMWIEIMKFDDYYRFMRSTLWQNNEWNDIKMLGPLGMNGEVDYNTYTNTINLCNIMFSKFSL